MKNKKEIIEYFFFETVSHLFRTVPHSLYSIVGKTLGAFSYDTLNLRKDIIITQLEAFQDKIFTEADHDRLHYLGKKVMENIGKSSAEFMARPKLKFFRNKRKFSMIGEGILEELMNQGRGGVIVTGHFGNWEWMGAIASVKNFPVSYLVADLHNKYISSAVNRTRKKWGIDVINQKNGILKALRKLNDGYFVAVLADQDAGKNGVFVPFLGLQASTTRLPAFLSERTGAPIIPAFIIPKGTKYIVHIEQPIYPEKFDYGKEMNIQKLTEEYSTVIEKYVIKYPDLWFWPHRRWKTQPKGSSRPFSYKGLPRKINFRRRTK